MKRVIVESPYAAAKGVDAIAAEVQIWDNVKYGRRALLDCLRRGEAPIASHLLYTLRGVLNDSEPLDRKLGIEAGLAWRQVADLQVFYTDRGWSQGMLAVLRQCLSEKREYELRSLDGKIQVPEDLKA